MDADDVHKLERHVQRDIALVVSGALIGLAVGLLITSGFVAVWTAALAIGAILLMVAVRMRR